MNKIVITVLILPFFIFAQNGCWTETFSGRGNSIFLKNDGSTWITGLNNFGQLGLGTTTGTSQLTAMNLSGFVKFAVGDYHVLAIKSDGTLWGWGQNFMGQLGDGTLIDRNSPVQIGTDTNWAEIATGRRHSTAIKTDGTLWAWGYNGDGDLGVGNTNTYLSPVQVGVDSDWSAISMGYYHSIALKTNGTLWSWGWNEFGQLGNGTTVSQTVPIQVGTSQSWLMAQGGNGHTIALKNDGSLWGWGWNSFGQLGDGTTVDQLLPTPIGTGTVWSSIAVGLAHTLALDTSGVVWSCGLNNTGQLGYGAINSNPNTSLIPIALSNSITSMSSGSHHNSLIDADSNILSFGSNTSGQFGNGTTTSNSSPLKYIDCASLQNTSNVLVKLTIECIPNPSSQFIILQNREESTEQFNFTISDLSGRTVLHGRAAFGEAITIERLASGNYGIQLTTDSGARYTEKLVKM